MEKVYKFITKYKLPLLLVVLTIPALIPLLRGDFFHFSDEPHVADLYEMIRAIGSGQLPPRWAPDMSFGYGYPLFNFYYPLPFYIGTLFYYITGSLVTSLKLLFLITVPISAYFMYKWLRLHTTNVNSLIGVIIYTYTPYRAVDLYIRGALGELFSFIFFPLTAYLTYKVMKDGRLRDMGLLGLSISLFILSHNLAPLFFVPWIGLYALVMVLSGDAFKNLFKVGFGIALGFLGSLYFWLPALIEKVNLVGHTPFNYLDHFPFIKQLIFSSWGYGASHPGIYDDISFQIGIPNLALIAALVIVIYKGRAKLKSKIFPIYFLVSILFIIFLMNIRSAPLWELSTLAAYIQFPWRLLLLTTFLTSSLVIFVNPKKLAPRVFLLIIVAVSLLSSFFYFKPSEYFQTNDEYYLRRFFADRTTSGMRDELSQEYLNYSEDYLLLPLWTKERPSSLPESKIYSSEVDVKKVSEVTPIEYVAEVSSETGGKMSVAIYYYPGWRVEVDGVDQSIDIEEPNGNISFMVGGGEKKIRVYWEETPFREATNYLSFAALATVLYFTVRGGKIKSKRA